MNLSDRQAVLQADNTECGLACLAMICAANGRAETLRDLRRIFPVSLAGTNLADLVTIADALGFSARGVRCEMDQLRQLSTPCILHWDLNHYVVLQGSNKKKAIIFDPARGRRVLPLTEVSKHFTGVALELTASPTFVRKKPAYRVRLGDLWTRVSGAYSALVQVLLLTLILQVFTLLMPLANQIVIDDAIGHDDKSLLYSIIFGFLVLAIVQTSIETLRSYVQLHASQSISVQLSANLLRHLLRLPASFFKKRNMGDLMTRFSSIGPVQEFLTNGIVGVVLDGIMLVPCGIIMVLYSPVLSALVCVDVFLAAAVQLVSFRTNRRFSDQAISLSARTQSIFLETLRTVPTLKLSGKEAERHSVWQNAVIDQQSLAYRQTGFTLWGRAGFGLLMTTQGLLMLLLGALAIIRGSMTLGMFMAFQAYAVQFSSRAKSLISQFSAFRLLEVHLERLADIVQTEEENGLSLPASISRPLNGALELRHVSFRYAPQDPWILRDVNLQIGPGERVVFVGPSGGGKSTLLNILTSLYPPTEGTILVDKAPLSTIGPRAFRQQIGVVMQDDQLLSGNIAENVAFFDPQIDMARVHEACMVANIHDEVLGFPLGYNTFVGEMGSILSGGQKQRLLLARALYRKPRYLFMDEGTANLDGALEGVVLANLSQLGITQVMVAHREAAMKFAERTISVESAALYERPS